MRSDDKLLSRECHLFAQYMTGMQADPYVVQKYGDAHRRKPSFAATTVFDRFLLTVATLHPVLTTIVDGYTRFFAPGCALRKKLVLLLAILESSPASQRFLERPDSASKAVLTLAFLGRVVPLAVGLMVSLVTLLPIQLALGASRTTK